MEDVLERISLLDKEDQQKIADFVRLLMEREKYKLLEKEIVERRAEFAKGDTLTHEEFWDDIL